MKKHVLLTGLMFIFLILAAPQAHAAGFAFEYDGSKYPVEPDMVTAWQGRTKLPARSNIIQTFQFKDMFARFAGGYKPAPVSTKTYAYRPAAIYAYLKNLSSQINVPVQEPLLEIKDGKVAQFTPPQDGLTADLYASTFAAIAALEGNRATSTLAVSTIYPTNSLAATNDYGINELVARGQSAFKGSPKNRRHNIQVGVSKVNGVLIAPGEEFSFNKYLGPVEESEGFLPELVIKRTGTVPELGGGLCQVSSTVFRAAINAGLPITQRRNHSYAVQYYAPQGTDATIYPGVIDLKFKNDTPGHLLLWAHFKDKDTLIYELYGTKDTREVTVYTPTQYDRKPDGSMKATWKRDVTKDGVTRNDVFNSVYLPPALFHKEEQFVNSNGQTSPATTTPAATN